MDESLLTYEAALRGISRGELDGPNYEPASYGVHLPTGAAADLAVQCRAVQRVLPEAAVWSHYTAAALRGWSLPWLPTGLPLLASLPGRGTHLYRRGVYVARTDEAVCEPEARKGLRIAAAPAILAQLAQDLSLLDLIAVIDSALHCRDTTIKEMEGSLRPYQRGGPMLRRALAYADGRAESWWESVLRMVHVWSSIEVEPQYKVRTDRGHVIARGDLWVVGTRRLHEYDGDVHDAQRVRRRDLGRDKALARIDWERYGYISTDITRGPDHIIRDAESARGLPHRPERLARWRSESARSTLGAAGRRRLARRLDRFDRS